MSFKKNYLKKFVLKIFSKIIVSKKFDFFYQKNDFKREKIIEKCLNLAFYAGEK